MSAKIFEFVATIQCSAVIAAPDETTARQCVETWERAWFETGEIVGVVDVDLTDVRPAPRTKEVQEDVAHIVLTKRAGQSEKPCALEAERDALRERCEKLEWVNTELAKQLKAQDFALEHILDALDIDPEETHIDIKNGDSVVVSVSIAELHSRAQAALAATEAK